MNLGVIFLTGVTTGGFTCLALQGGLLATAIASQRDAPTGASQRDVPTGASQRGIKSTLLPTAIFLIAKISAYTIVGFLLGWLGSIFTLSITAQIIIQFIVGIFMIITALHMLDVHPIFRRFVLTPPKAVFKFMRANAKSGSYFSPLILGLATVFLPCGTTQAMEVQAIVTAKPFLGAAIMFAFTLGTSPLFFILGSLATKFSQSLEKYVYPVAAALVLVLGILAIDNGLTLSGSPFTLKEFWSTATGTGSTNTLGTATVVGQKQSALINVYATGYEPNRMTLKAGIPTTLSIVTNRTQGCTRAITFPTLGIQKILPESGTTEIELPTLAKGRVPFSCSMGMFTGTIEVI